MAIKNPRKIFVNLSVQDLARSKAFFEALGFTFNAQFTNDHGACMIVSEEAYVMLLPEASFRNFTTREICDRTAHTEALLALSCASREEVTELVTKALAAGGSAAMPPQDHGFMYGHSFYDLDGHHWEVLWMDPAYVQPG